MQSAIRAVRSGFNVTLNHDNALVRQVLAEIASAGDAVDDHVDIRRAQDQGRYDPETQDALDSMRAISQALSVPASSPAVRFVNSWADGGMPWP